MAALYILEVYKHAKLLYYSPPSVFYDTLKVFRSGSSCRVQPNPLPTPFLCLFLFPQAQIVRKTPGLLVGSTNQYTLPLFQSLLLSLLCLFFRMHLWNLTVSLNWAKASFSLTWLFLFELVSIASAVVSVTFLVHSVVEFIWLICSCRFTFSSRSWLELCFIFQLWCLSQHLEKRRYLECRGYFS